MYQTVFLIFPTNLFHPIAFLISTLSFQLMLHACLVMSDSLQPYGLQSISLLYPWDFPGNNTGEGCHFLLQGIFLTQGSNPGLLCFLCWQADILPLHHLGSPKFKPKLLGSFWILFPFTHLDHSVRNSVVFTFKIYQESDHFSPPSPLLSLWSNPPTPLT